MPNYNYSKDYPIARKTEVEIAKLLCEKYKLKFHSRCDDNRWDFILEKKDGGQLKFEVKEDFTHARTGNIGVEYSCRNKPSGISTSQADYYVFKVHNADGSFSIQMIQTAKLKQLIERVAYHRTVNGGDIGSNSMNYLFHDFVIYRQSINII